MRLYKNGLRTTLVTGNNNYGLYNLCESEQNNIKRGIPQGSILGPLLHFFILYVNGMINSSDVLDLILFSDDTTFLYSHPNFENERNCKEEELEEVIGSKPKKLSVSACKIQLMILETRHMVSNMNEFHMCINVYNFRQYCFEKSKIY